MSLMQILGLNGVKESLNEAVEWFLEIIKDFKSALSHFVLGTIFTVVFTTLVVTHTIDFSKLENTKAEDLPDLMFRIGFVLFYYFNIY